MSRVVEHKDTIYLCGQTCGEPDTDIKEQTQVVLQKISDLLEQYGSSPRHMLSVTIYLRDMAHFKAMNEVWDAWLLMVLIPHEPAWKQEWQETHFWLK